MKTYLFTTESRVNRPLEEVFAFFSNPLNLDVVTPPELKFEFLTPEPIKMGAGTIIDYRLKIHHFPVRWQSKITVWEPPFKFVDIQIRGPYRKWIHHHIFEKSVSGTKVTDSIEYAVPGWIFSPVIHKIFVERDIRRIFDYRRKKYSEIFT